MKERVMRNGALEIRLASQSVHDAAWSIEEKAMEEKS